MLLDTLSSRLDKDRRGCKEEACNQNVNCGTKEICVTWPFEASKGRGKQTKARILAPSMFSSNNRIQPRLSLPSLTLSLSQHQPLFSNTNNTTPTQQHYITSCLVEEKEERVSAREALSESSLALLRTQSVALLLLCLILATDTNPLLSFVLLRRHRKILRDNIQGITKPAIRRLARRGASLLSFFYYRLASTFTRHASKALASY